MIPNIFVSSTISDLRYLRDAIRDAIDELSYRPVMSDHGEVGYLHPMRAADACYKSIAQCQMAIIIIGKKYGDVKPGEISVTHREFITAKENGIPTISLVESQVWNFKEVFDAGKKRIPKNSFPGMDNPKMTFSFIDDIRNSSVYNGVIPFSAIAEAKRLLKLQIADFVGDRLSELVQPLKSDLRDMLSELMTLRHEIRGEDRIDPQPFLKAARYLLDDKNKQYRALLEMLFGSVDTAVPAIIKCKSFDDVLKAADVAVEIQDNIQFPVEINFKNENCLAIHTGISRYPTKEDPKPPMYMWAYYVGKKLKMNSEAKRLFDYAHEFVRRAAGA